MHHLIFGLYKEAKVSVLQANAQLAQKGECWNQRSIRGPGSILAGGNILPLMPILAILPISSSLYIHAYLDEIHRLEVITT